MTNFDGTYSLSEVAAKVGRSHAWVKKIEKKFRIPDWGSGQRGKRSSYGHDKIRTLQKIKVLSDVSVGLTDIKQIYDAEKEIIKFTERHFPIDKNTKRENIGGGGTLYLIGDAPPVEYDRLKYGTNKEAAAEFDHLWQNYKEAMRMVLFMLEEHKKIVEDHCGELEGLVGKKKG